MDAAKGPRESPLAWLLTLIMALDLDFIITFLYNQFRRLPYPTDDFTGKIVIVTGATTGLGLQAARHFVRLNAAKVILGCNELGDGERARAFIEHSTGRKGVVEVWPLDLCSFESVRQFCKRADRLDRLDVVVENAAVALVDSQGTLAEGYETTITVNVISTFLMALTLLPTLRRTTTKFNIQPRLVIVSSDAHFMSSFSERKTPNIFTAFKSTAVAPDRYQTSKLLQIFAVRQLAPAMSDPSSNTKGSIILTIVNPGFCRTSLFRHNKFPASLFLAAAGRLVGRSAEVGSRVLIYAAVAEPGMHGKWLDSCEIREPSAFVRSEEGQRDEERVYKELMGILEEVEPGITDNI